MDFEDLIYMTMDEIEHSAIYQIAKLYGIEVTPDKADRCAAEIREDLTMELHGCFPYYDCEKRLPCYLTGECDYSCEKCPMTGKRWELYWEFIPDSESERDMIVALIRAIKLDGSYDPTESEIETAIKIIKGE